MQGAEGDDTYLFASGDGHDRINNNDVDPASRDTLLFTDSPYDQLWWSRRGDHLVVDIIGTDDQVQINHWFLHEAAQLDVIYAGERFLDRHGVDQLVNAMAAFAGPVGVGDVIPEHTRLELEPTLAAVWQSAA
ncbi:MAG: hypothetical protein R3E50_10005 [Halioglobus sp.]